MLSCNAENDVVDDVDDYDDGDEERMRRHLVNRVRWLVGAIMYWIPVRN